MDKIIYSYVKGRVIKKMKSKFAVIGDPINHSLSPQIHNMFASELNISLNYERIHSSKNSFVKNVSTFFKTGKGLNITAPHKENAWKIAQVHSNEAKLSGVVNTLWMEENGIIMGDNTDGRGFVRDLTENLKFSVANKNILLIGAGGAIKGILRDLIDLKPYLISIVNRTASKSQAISDKFCGTVKVIDSNTKVNFPFDLVVNGTSCNVNYGIPGFPVGSVDEKTLVYDMSYGKGTENFLDYVIRLNAYKVSDGIGMLVEQAAESFYLWHKKRPSTPKVIAFLQQGIN